MKPDPGRSWRPASTAGSRGRRRTGSAPPAPSRPVAPRGGRRPARERRSRPVLIAVWLATAVVVAAFIILLARQTIWLAAIAVVVFGLFAWRELRS